MSKACAYIRVSSEDQVDGFSLDTQERECRRYATSNKQEIVRIFPEKGVSAKTAAGRPVLQEMLAWIKKQKGVETVIVYKLDRLSRNQLDFHRIKEALKQSGVCIRSATEPHQTGPAGILNESMLAMFAEYDNAVRGERSRAGMAEAIKAGWWCWSAPVGYKSARTSDGKPTLEIDPATAPVIAEAFRRYSSKMAHKADIAKFLREKGVRSRNGKIISPEGVNNILTNPAYSGRIRSTITDGEMWKGNWTALVPVELWDRCQEHPSSQAGRRHRDLSEDFPLRGVLLCSECSKALTGYFVPRRNGGPPYRFYSCQDNCSKVLGNADKVDAEFQKLMDGVAFPEPLINRIRGTVIQGLSDSRKGVHQEQVKAQKALAGVKERKQRLLDKLLSGTISDETYKSVVAQIESEIIRLQVAAHDLENEEAVTEQEIDAALAALRSPYAVWQGGTATLRRQLIEMLFRSGLYMSAGGTLSGSKHEKRRQDSGFSAGLPAVSSLAPRVARDSSIVQLVLDMAGLLSADRKARSA